MIPSGHTRVAGVIGDPVRHSLSPAIHNAAFAAAELDWVYVAFPVPDGSAGAALDAMRTLELAGLSVTMPHKQSVAAAVDRCTEVAAALGAVNCVFVEPVDDRAQLVGDNTDGAGFLGGLAADSDLDIAGARVLLLGGGGAARAVAHAVAGAGAAEVVVHNRTVERAAEVARMAGAVGRVATEGEEVAGFGLVVNATSVGMTVPGADPSAVPLAVDRLDVGQVVVDLVYEPPETTWLAQCRARGVEAHNGRSMLVHQAAVAFERWTGRVAPISVMADAARRALGH